MYQQTGNILSFNSKKEKNFGEVISYSMQLTYSNICSGEELTEVDVENIYKYYYATCLYAAKDRKYGKLLAYAGIRYYVGDISLLEDKKIREVFLRTYMNLYKESIINQENTGLERKLS